MIHISKLVNIIYFKFKVNGMLMKTNARKLVYLKSLAQVI
jgi:hypothetical protein